MQLILASKSPRRKELLKSHGYDFVVEVSNFQEISSENDPIKRAEFFSFSKAKSVFDKLINKKECVVLSADTIVSLNGTILEKPVDQIQAVKMLKQLSGKKHIVVTAYCLISPNKTIVGNCVTEVTFNNLTDSVIFEYIESGLYKGKAGAYGIQDGFSLVKSYNGSYSNVVGLPMEKIVPLLNEFI